MAGLAILLLPLFGVACVLLARWVWRRGLNPISIPVAYEKQAGRERFLLTVALILQFLGWIGLGLMMIICAVAISRHARDTETLDPLDRIVPNFRIQDLLAITFSVGCFLMLLTNAAIITTAKIEYFYLLGATVMLPASFVCMLYRLNTNAVPMGFMRIALVFLSPYIFLYAIFTGVILSVSPFWFIASLTFEPISFISGIAIGILIGLGWCIVWLFADAAREAALSAQKQSVNQAVMAYDETR